VQCHLLGGRATRSQESDDHNSDNSRSRYFGNALEPAELLPRNAAEARLIPRAGTGFESLAGLGRQRFKLPRGVSEDITPKSAWLR